MYGVYNSNLLFHASVPMNEDGTLKEVCVEGQNVAGRELMERVEQLVRTAYDDDGDSIERQRAILPCLTSLRCRPSNVTSLTTSLLIKKQKVGTIAYALMPTFVTTSWMLLE